MRVLAGSGRAREQTAESWVLHRSPIPGTAESRIMPGPHWFGRASLGAQVSLLVAIIVTIVVTAVAYLEVRIYDRDIERTLEHTARLAAESAASVAEREPRDALD